MIKRRVAYGDGSFVEFKDTDKIIAEEYAVVTGGRCFRIQEDQTEEEFQQEQDNGLFTTEKRIVVTANEIDESGYVIKAWWQSVKDFFGNLFS